jgi:hypothetical protein
MRPYYNASPLLNLLIFFRSFLATEDKWIDSCQSFRTKIILNSYVDGVLNTR